jgi:hypothetical protein
MNNLRLKTTQVLHLDEIDKTCKLIYWGVIIGFLIAFNFWAQMGMFTKSAYLNSSVSCPEYFQSCFKYIFFDGPPHSYGQTIFYAFLLVFIMLSCIYALKDKWLEAFVLLIPPTIFKFLGALFLVNEISTPFEYFHLTFVIILLFFPNKVSFFKISFCLIYFLSGTIKIHEGWILGTYFSSLRMGLPIFSDVLIPFLTNFVIFLEITLTWSLLSKNRKIQLLVVCLYIIFHLFSASIVGYRYPIHCLPLLIPLFLINEDKFKFPKFNFKNIIPYSFIILILIFHSIPYFIQGDQKVTYEGVRLSVGMFDANRQCSSTVLYNYQDGTAKEVVTNTKYSGVRCVPYQWWYRLKKECKKKNVKSIDWTYDISVNGNPFYRVVNTDNVCELDYEVFGHNYWIETESNKSGHEVVGYPQKNTTGGPWFPPEERVIFEHQAIFLSPSQKIMNNNMSLIKIFYSLLALLCFLYFGILRIFKDQNISNKN